MDLTFPDFQSASDETLDVVDIMNSEKGEGSRCFLKSWCAILLESVRLSEIYYSFLCNPFVLHKLTGKDRLGDVI